MSEAPIQTSNHLKYQTSHPLVRWLLRRFHDQLASLVSDLRPASVLDAGCGEGETLDRLEPLLPADVAGFDLNPVCVRFVSRRLPGLNVSVENIYDLPYDSDRFDLVLCLEVLEHLDSPGRALRELTRVSNKRLILSVPHEPYFRIGSLLRGKYVTRLGNHPEHVQHWNPRRLRRFLKPEVEVLSLRSAFPWLIAHCGKRGDNT